MADLATEWKPTKDTVRRFTGIGVLLGGPDAGTVAEHAHCEAEVSVHFRPNHAGGRMVAEHTHLYASNQPHSGGWKKGHKVIVFLLSPELLEGAADELSRRGRFEITPVRYLRDRIFEGMGRIVLDEYRTPDQLSALYMESIGNLLAGYIARNYTETCPD